MARRRETETFSLSFLDVMSVGLGSVILIFLIINHASERRTRESLSEIQARVGEQQARYIEHQFTAEELGKAIEESEQKLKSLRAQLAELSQQMQEDAPPAEEIENKRAEIASLREQVNALENRVASLREQARKEDQNANIQRLADGNRLYLTGLKVGGNRILLLVDASASMLSDTIVGAIRRRNMSEADRSASPKWQRAIKTVEWLAARMPADAKFQIYVFNTEVRSVLPQTTGQWLEIGEGGAGIERALEALRKVVPGSGTSLYRAFASTASLTPRTDNIFLITDGLPTQDMLANLRGVVTPRQRLNLFSEAMKVVPRVVSVNVVLFPMEGDPMAASALWQLAQLTGGVLLSPTEDWP